MGAAGQMNNLLAAKTRELPVPVPLQHHDGRRPWRAGQLVQAYATAKPKDARKGAQVCGRSNGVHRVGDEYLSYGFVCAARKALPASTSRRSFANASASVTTRLGELSAARRTSAARASIWVQGPQ
jgi:hypothetical protein